MIKICFVTTASITLNTFVTTIANNLHKTGNYDITFICDPDSEFESSLPEYINFIPVTMERGVSKTVISAVKELKKIFEKENFDIVQYSTPNASLAASTAARLAGVPIRIYGQWGIYYVGQTGIKRHIFKQIEKIVAINSTYVEPDSFGNLEFSWDEGLYNPEKSGVVYNGSVNGVDLNRYNISKKCEWRNQVRENFGITDDEFVVGFVGRITRDKGINELFQAMRNILSKYPGVKLFLVGSLENEDLLNQQLFQWANSEERVIFAGRTNEIEKYYAAMDVYVLPSYREGFGLASIEAQAMGVPVVLTNIPGPSEALIPNLTGFLVRKKDSHSLELAIETLVINPDLVKDFGTIGRNFVEENFDSEEYARQMIERRRFLVDQYSK